MLKKMNQLFIDTTTRNHIILKLQTHRQYIEKKIASKNQQADKLLKNIDILLKKANLNSNNLHSIKINNKGGSFTSLRIGIITANALNYARINIINQTKKTKYTNPLKIFNPVYKKIK